MNQSNLLRLPRHHYFSCWQPREIEIWVNGLKSVLVRLMTLGCLIRLLGFYLSPKPVSLALQAITVVTLLSGFAVMRLTVNSTLVRKAMMTVYLNLCQGYIACIMVNLYPSHLGAWSVSSTILMCIYEIPSFFAWWSKLLIISRQFLVLEALYGHIGKAGNDTEIPLFMIGATALLMVFFTVEARERTKDRYRFCDSLEEQEAKMKNILQAIPEGVAVITVEMKIPCCNNRLEMILMAESKEGDVIKKLNALCCGKLGTECVSMLKAVKEFLDSSDVGVANFGVTEISDSHYEWKGTKCVWGDTTACILTVSDISSWVTARVKLQQESDSKTALLRFVSHELRTPTNAILNLVANVKAADNINPEQKLDLEIVLTSTQFLLSVINDLLDFSKIVADKFALVKQTFDVRKELSETVQLIELQCRQKGLFLGTKIDNFIPQLVFSDPNRLKQVLLNLLGNALKFTFKGGIRVICNMTDHNSLKITVKDSGIGIPASKIPGLGQLFGTIDGTQRINPQGSGLGLYISNSLAQRLGKQSIGIRSKEGIGSEFFFEVSIYQEEVTGEGCVDTTTADIADERDSETYVSLTPIIGGKGSSPTLLPDVLIVDDCDFNRVVLLKLLESSHIPADFATTGLRAVSLIRNNVRRGHFYRLILMDIEMPEMDGITATAEIRAMEVTGEVPIRSVIIACSAHRGREDQDRFVRAGMDGVLEKPVSRAKLSELVRSLAR